MAEAEAGTEPMRRTPSVLAGARRGRLIARLLIAWVVLGGLAAAVYSVFLAESRVLPIEVVVVQGEMHGLSRRALESTLSDQIRGGILTQDLRVIKTEVEDLPWVHRAELRRVWPDRVEVRVREHHASARWGEDGLVTPGGIVFRPHDGVLPAGLVRLDSNDDAQAPEMVERFAEWGPRLAELGLLVDRLRRSPRGDWILTLLGGTELHLGSEDVAARFDRLIAAYPLIERIGNPDRVDLRYSNGLAVIWHPKEDPLGVAERMVAN